MSGIGPLIGAAEVCAAVESTLQTWLPSVLAQVNAEHDLTLDVPTTYDMPDAEALRNGNANVPAVVVSSTGVSGTAVNEDDTYSATWGIVVTAFARGADYRKTASNVRGYALAIRTAMLQHGRGSLISEIAWDGEEYAALDSRAARTLGGAFVRFSATVDEVTAIYGGPLTPPDPPDAVPAPDPIVEETFIDVEPFEETP